MTRLMVLFAFAAALGFTQKGPFKLPPEIVPQEVTHPDPLSDRVHFEKQFENSRTRVLRLHLAADDTSKLYETGDGLFICMRECHVRLLDPAGHDQDIHLQDAESRWVGAGTRRMKNLSTRPVEMLFVEFLGSAHG
jgi:predicted small lipoprotein YifL